MNTRNIFFFFMENWRELSQTYHQILLLNKSSELLHIKHNLQDAWFVNGKTASAAKFLTLVLLNKLRCHAHFLFSANQIT